MNRDDYEANIDWQSRTKKMQDTITELSIILGEQKASVKCMLLRMDAMIDRVDKVLEETK